MSRPHIAREARAWLPCSCCLAYILLVISVLLAPFFWPSLVPFSLMHYWFWSGSLPEIAFDALPLFLVGAGATLLLIFLARKRIFAYLEDHESIWLPSRLLNMLTAVHWSIRTPYVARSGIHLVKSTFWLTIRGLFTALTETVLGLWLFFYGYCIALSLLNSISFGLIQWVYLYALRPVGDILTLRLLHPYLYQSVWVIGAAVIGFPPYWPHRNYFKDLPFWFLLTRWPNMFLYLLVLRHGLFPTLLIYTLYTLLVQLLLPRLLKQPEEESEQPEVNA
ncbi:hypothetical protein [Ktedonosporobacter rubrisoli]|nr:hypothetical protein [Ktedonosporobacter rubrisoli]